MKKILSLILILLVITAFSIPFLAIWEGRLPISPDKEIEEPENEPKDEDCITIGHNHQPTDETSDFYTLVDYDTCHRDTKTKYNCTRCTSYEYVDRDSSDNIDLSHVRDHYVNVYCNGTMQTHVMVCKNCGGQYIQYMECPGNYHPSGNCGHLPI